MAARLAFGAGRGASRALVGGAERFRNEVMRLHRLRSTQGFEHADLRIFMSEL
jgi:hypothetical protein